MKLITWRKSIFTRLIVTFVLIVSPLYLVAYFIYNWGIDSIRNELDSSMKSQVNFHVSNLDTEINRINMLLFNTLYDGNLTDLADKYDKMTDYDRYSSINNLQQRLLVLQNSNLYVKEVTAFIPSANMAVSSNNGMQEIDRGALTFFNTARPEMKSPLLHYQDDLYLRALLPLEEEYRLDKQVHLLALALSGERIETILRQLNTNVGSEGGALLWLPGNRFIPEGEINPEFYDMLEREVVPRFVRFPQGTMDVQVGDKAYFVVYESSAYLQTVMIKFVPMTALTEKSDQFRRLFLWFSIAAVLIIAIYMLSAFRFVQQPLLQLIRAFRQLEIGNLNTKIQLQRKDEYGFLFHRFNDMVRNLNQLIDQVYKQQILTQQAELKQLQSQINPHFLYNTYFVLYNMAMSEDYDNVKEFTRQLGAYFKFITRNAAEEVPLRVEAEHARTYCDIQALRFYNRLRVEFGGIPEEWLEVSVPRLILQPIIENAFEYGLGDKKTDGLLSIRFTAEPAGGLSIAVEDNGPIVAAERIRELNGRLEQSGNAGEVTALLNIHGRLRLRFGPGSGLRFEHGSEGGLRVNIRIIPNRKERGPQA